MRIEFEVWVRITLLIPLLCALGGCDDVKTGPPQEYKDGRIAELEGRVRELELELQRRPEESDSTVRDRDLMLYTCLNYDEAREELIERVRQGKVKDEPTALRILSQHSCEGVPQLVATKWAMLTGAEMKEWGNQYLDMLYQATECDEKMVKSLVKDCRPDAQHREAFGRWFARVSEEEQLRLLRSQEAHGYPRPFRQPGDPGLP